VLIGIDVLRIDELDCLLERSWFRWYAYTDEELNQASEYSSARAREFLAGRFAGKESTVKVLRCGFTGGVLPRHVAILRGDNGAPYVRLTGAAARRASQLGVVRIQVSISHKSPVVVAVAIGEPHGYTEPEVCGDLTAIAGELVGRVLAREPGKER
jgi:holo-[acyl-carrier protein] synthase